jgi:hypothetical protein
MKERHLFPTLETKPDMMMLRNQDSTMFAFATSVQGKENHQYNYIPPLTCTCKGTELPPNLRLVASGFFSMLRFDCNTTHLVFTCLPLGGYSMYFEDVVEGIYYSLKKPYNIK